MEDINPNNQDAEQKKKFGTDTEIETGTWKGNKEKLNKVLEDGIKNRNQEANK